MKKSFITLRPGVIEHRVIGKRGECRLGEREIDAKPSVIL